MKFLRVCYRYVSKLSQQIIKKIKSEEPFVVSVYSKIFSWLQWISLLKWLQKYFPFSKNKRFIEIWALGHLFLSIFCLAVIPINFLNLPLINLSLFFCYGIFRLFEVIIVQINLLLFDEYRSNKDKWPYFITSFRRTVLLLIHNYLEIIVWFALIYHTFYNNFDFRNLCLNSVWGSLYFSLVTMTTLGYGDITPITTTGIIIVIFQTLIGIFMALLLLARFVALLPKTKSIDPFEQ